MTAAESTQAMLQQMQTLELRLLHTDFRNDASALEAMLADDFHEVSPRGQLTSRAEVVQWLLRKEPTHRWQCTDWHVTELAASVRLVRYHAVQVIPPSRSRGAVHCSLWSYDEALRDWRLRFHQSCKLEHAAPPAVAPQQDNAG